MLACPGVKGTAVVCVCVPKPGIDRKAAADALSAAVAGGLGGAFRPAEVVFVADLPRTRATKVMRRVVRAAWLGEEPGDLSTLANPEAVQAIRAARHRSESRSSAWPTTGWRRTFSRSCPNWCRPCDHESRFPDGTRRQ